MDIIKLAKVLNVDTSVSKEQAELLSTLGVDYITSNILE